MTHNIAHTRGARPRAHAHSDILRHAAEVSEGLTTSVERTEQCLDRIADPQGEGSRTFIKVWNEQARKVAAVQDTLTRSDYGPSVLAGVAVSIKDLLDVKGEITRAGSTALDRAAPAVEDAPVVKRLKAAGAVLVGRTNMTQFAYSVVGLNSHYGTPGNPWDRTRTPGGSSSGAAVSVADGMAVAAIGSDTVGSIRVPAALCGVVGFKPTQRRVPRAGSIPLSTTLDTIGPLARTVTDCALVYGIIASEAFQPLDRHGPRGLRLAIPRQVVLNDLDAQVGQAFTRACTLMSSAGVVLDEADFTPLAEVHSMNGNGTIQPPEALAWHRGLLQRRGNDYDPRIKARIETGLAVHATDYIKVLERRQQLMDAFDQLTERFDALVLPTVSIIAPTFEACALNEDSIRTKLLRNPSLFNFLDRCSISIPIHRLGEAPVGLMLVGGRDDDWRLLKIARAIESLFLSA